MATKMIYFVVDGRKEKAEFRSSDTEEEVRALFRSAAEGCPSDILKLYNSKGSIVNISPKLAENTPDTPYTLEVIATHLNGTETMTELGINADDIERRLERLEKLVLAENGQTPEAVHDMKERLDYFRQKLENVDHLSWLGLYKDISSPGTSLHRVWNKKETRTSLDHVTTVSEKFQQISRVAMTDEVREYLKQPTFDNWQWDDAEMLVLLRQMYIDLRLTDTFNIQLSTLHTWLIEIYKNYNQVPFHNFKHCFMVTQMMYGLICLTSLTDLVSDLDILTLITSAICHDLDHPGYNNAYQVNAGTELAIRYNDISPLENHHCSVAFEILERPGCNIVESLTQDQYKCFRQGMIRCILATDMAKHSEILNSFKQIIGTFDFRNSEHKALLYTILIKTADVSNESRPLQVAGPWLDCLLSEYFNQSDMEKLEGLPVAPFMDREKVTKPSSQVGFIKFVLLPLFQALADLFPVLTNAILSPVHNALQYYQTMQAANEEENKRKEPGTSDDQQISQIADCGSASTSSSNNNMSTSGHMNHKHADSLVNHGTVQGLATKVKT